MKKPKWKFVIRRVEGVRSGQGLLEKFGVIQYIASCYSIILGRSFSLDLTIIITLHVKSITRFTVTFASIYIQGIGNLCTRLRLYLVHKSRPLIERK